MLQLDALEDLAQEKEAICPLMENPQPRGAPGTVVPHFRQQLYSQTTVCNFNLIRFTMSPLLEIPGDPPIKDLFDKSFCKMQPPNCSALRFLALYILGFLNVGTILAAKPPYHIPAKFLSFSSQNCYLFHPVEYVLYSRKIFPTHEN